MEFDVIIKLVNLVDYLGEYIIIDHRECIKDLIVTESVANHLNKQIPKPWKVVIEAYEPNGINKDPLVKVKILNEIAEIIDETVIHDDINHSSIAQLKNYKDITLRILRDRYKTINESIENHKDTDEDKLIIYGPVIGQSKKILDMILESVK